jgi:hypothetical protein
LFHRGGRVLGLEQGWTKNVLHCVRKVYSFLMLKQVVHVVTSAR